MSFGSKSLARQNENKNTQLDQKSSGVIRKNLMMVKDEKQIEPTN